MKKIMIALVIIAMLAPVVALADTSEKVKITGIRVQGNRTWISFTPKQDMGCEAKNSVEVANDNNNQKLIVSLAMSAMLAGKEVYWAYNHGNCSTGTTSKIIVGGLKVFD